jgi:voltage-gated potassium channel
LDVPLIITSLIFLGAYSWQVIYAPAGILHDISEAVVQVTWVVFLIDYIVSIFLTERGQRLTLINLFGLAVVALPMLRPLRLLRLVTLFRVMNRTTKVAFRGRVATYVACSASLLTYIASLAVLDAERAAEGSKITNFGDALWWAFVTITTVGYGDYFPVTIEGRLIAVGLMLGGISLIGVVTATLASWIVEKVSVLQSDTDQNASSTVRKPKPECTMRNRTAKVRYNGCKQY